MRFRQLWLFYILHNFIPTEIVMYEFMEQDFLWVNMLKGARSYTQ
jgi:hypothetical protein